MASEEYSQEVLVTFYLLFEEANAFLALDEDYKLHAEVDPTYYDPDGDILILEAFLNNEPPTPIPNQGDCSPETQEEIKLCEAKTVKSSIDEPPEVNSKTYLPFLNNRIRLYALFEMTLLAHGKMTTITSHHA
ncbi:hypothetical protein Tco_1514733 [Tanacetum coccineum]